VTAFGRGHTEGSDYDLTRRRKDEELNRAIQFGIDDLDRGECAELDLADVRRRVREQLAKTKR
jgi:hypothetical protein